MSVARVNGTDLFFREAGRGHPCLVMHGGLGLDHTYLHPWLDPLGDVLRLVYYDHRGNGRSGRPPAGTITFERLADDADALRQHLGLERIAILGHSYGGFVAQHYALRHPGRLSHLILADTAAAWDYTEEIAANAARKGASTEALDILDKGYPSGEADLARALRQVTPLYFAAFDRELARRLFCNTIFSVDATVRGQALLRELDLVPHLGDISAPTLVLTGRDDFITPPSQAGRLRRGIPHAEAVIFERSGHFPYVEEPDAFFATIRDWLSRHP